MMDTLPRVPDVNGVVDEKLYSDLYTRTSWVDASIALDQIEKVSKQEIKGYLNEFIGVSLPCNQCPPGSLPGFLN